MSSKLYLVSNRFCSRARLWRRTQKSSSTFISSAGHQIAPATYRSYNTTSRPETSSLYSKISPLGSPAISVKPELDDWIKKGKKIRFAELQRIIHDLRKRKRFTQALQVSEWTKEQGIVKFSSVEYAVQLDLIGRTQGFLSAEKFFYSLPDEARNEKTYGALLNCYVRQCQTEKSMSHFQKMKEMGLASSTITYNNIMCLYTNTNQHEKIPEVLAEMKQNKVLPDNYTYRICINSYGVRSNLEGVEKTLRDMETQPHLAVDWNTYAVVANFYIKAGQKDKAIDALRKAEVRLDKKESISYNFLISLYARLEEKDEVLRLWELEKTACKKCINRDYINVLGSLAKLGGFEEAEKVLKEWESSGNCYDFRVPYTIITGYTKKGLPEKAEKLLKDLTEEAKSTTPVSWGTVAVGYIDKGDMKAAMDCMKVALSSCVMHEGWKLNNKVILRLLNWVGDKGSADDAEAFVGSLKSVFPVNREMYHALIKARIRSRKDVDFLLEDMKGNKIYEDEETRKILSSREN